MTDYRVGFRDLTEEHRAYDPAVEGSVPTWLDGALVRNGPARWSVDGAEADHWFDGLAHLTRFAFDDGEVRYTNHFPRTEAYQRAVEEGRFAGQFSSSGGYLSRLKSMLAGEATDNANVHVARLDGDLVALTETPNWIRVDESTLAYGGTLDYDDDRTVHHVTAHLRRDRETGATWGYYTTFGRTSEYVVFRIPAGTTRRERVASVEVDRPAYMHSFALTPGHVVLVEPPLVTHPAKFLVPGSGGFIDNYDWRPDRGTRFLVFTREGELIRELTTDAFFTFHTANAHRDGDALVVDLVAYDDASAVTDLSMRALRAGESGFPSGELRRYRLPLARDGDVAVDPLATAVEMPRFSPAVHMEPYRHVYAQSTRMDRGNDLVRVDVADAAADEAAAEPDSADAAVDEATVESAARGEGVARRWSEDGVFSGEPVFVPRPGGDREADGVVLSLCLDADAERSFLLVCDGELTELARVQLPHAVPFGFHGEYFASH